MKKINIFYISFLVIGIILIFINSCKKEEKSPKKDPIITWSNPADISFGTLLSAIQLNATADVPGSFVYTPAIGTKLNVGADQDLKVGFTPSDSTTNNMASKTVKINVIASPTVTDVDGNIYNTIIIGTQTWMVENLKTTKYNDGNAIPNVTDDTDWSNLTKPAYCWYGNNVSNKAIYGALYNWFSVNIGKLAPAGWHVSTDADWTTLENYLIANGYNYDGITTGNNYAKALASATGWNSYNGTGSVGNTDFPAKRNATGFTALPGGYRDYEGTFNDVGGFGSWWSVSEYSTQGSWYRYMFYYVSYIYKSSGNERGGFSVRCVRDN